MLASDRVTIGQLLVVVVTSLTRGRIVADLAGDLTISSLLNLSLHCRAICLNLRETEIF